MLVYEYPSIKDMTVTALLLAVLVGSAIAPIRGYLRWQAAGGLRERRYKRGAFWLSVALVPWAWLLCIPWLANDIVRLSAKFGGRGIPVEGVVAGLSCGGRAAGRLTLVGHADVYLIHGCPASDLIRPGDAVRLVSVTAPGRALELLRLERMSRPQLQ